MRLEEKEKIFSFFWKAKQLVAFSVHSAERSTHNGKPFISCDVVRHFGLMLKAAWHELKATACRLKGATSV